MDYNIKIKDNSFLIKIGDFGDEIDIESILRIDYSLLVVEIATFPVIMNRFGLMLADAESKLSEQKLELEIYESKRKKEIRNSLIEQKVKFTINQIDEELCLSAIWMAKRKSVIFAQKNRDYINSIYWACKEKSNKLDKLSMTIRDGDVESQIIESGIDRLHGIEIKNKRKLIGD